MHDVLDAGKTSLYRSAVARLYYGVVDRLDIQYAVIVCSKSMSSTRVNDWQGLKRVARYVKGCPDTEITFEWQTGPRQTHCAKRRWLSRRPEHAEECVSWKHSLWSSSASQLEQRPNRYRDELWRGRAVRCMCGGTALGRLACVCLCECLS